MGSKTDFHETAVLNTARGVALAAWTPYLALFSAAPSDAGGGTELTGNGYERQPVTFGAPVAGVMSNSAPVPFPAPTGSGWLQPTHAALMDAQTGGNMIYWDVLAGATGPFAAGADVTFPIGSIVASES